MMSAADSGETISLEAKNVTGHYILPEGTVPVVENCSMQLRMGDTFGLLGESGCGKTTFGKLLQGYVVPPLNLISGSVTIDGLDIFSMSLRERSRKVWGVKIARIPQYSMNSLNPVSKINSIVIDFMKSKMPSISEKEALSKAKARFEEVKLSADILDRYPFELSGGMKQRVVVIVSSLLDPKVIIADEPTTALDVTIQRSLIEFFFFLIKKRVISSLLVISHDIATLNQICNYFYVMYAGEIVEYGKRDAIINDPLHPYTKALINTIPTIDSKIKERNLKDIPGFPPDLRYPLKGCRFHERCSYCNEQRCELEEPKLLEVKKGRFVRCWLYE
ncbi:MAG: ABC transporter ATP-binding protein [Candidatus Bathyarchaeia archaeon]|jgi:peptide/nickel transport system ATP-binding protein